MEDRLSDIQSLADQYSSMSDDRNKDILEYVKLNQELNRTLLTNEKALQQNIRVLRKHSCLDSLEEEIKASKKGSKRRAELENRAREERERIAKVAAQAAENAYLEEYKKASIKKKAEMQKERSDSLKAAISATKEEYDLRIALAKEAGDKILQAELEKQQKGKLEALQQEQKSAEKMQTRLEETKSQRARRKRDEQGTSSFGDNVHNFLEERKSAQAKRKDDAQEKLAAAAAAFQAAVESGSEEQQKVAEAELENAVDEARKIEQEEQLAEAMEKAQEKMVAFVGSAIQDALNLITEYKGAMDSRLQGSEKNYKDIVDKATTMLSVNPFVESKKVVDAMKKATEEGIVYNIEQRAFLSEISNKIADTFDAFDSNLTRLIRIQQADSTAARLGMEATLTKLFNKMFEDNSYLSAQYDTVAATLLDASATMSRELAAEFEFTAQKWLGALYSLGLSGDTVNQIAQGLTYIATGDVTSMASNTQLQTLFAMASSRAGEDYANLFVEGLDASKTNTILASIVDYVKDIALNSDNNVVRSAYGDIFNVSISDLKAISNITAEEIQSLADLSYDYSAMLEETKSQLTFSNLWNRSSLGTMMETVYRNATFGMGMDMAANPATFALYKLTSYMTQENLEMAIPFINAMGFGLDLNTNIEDIMKLGLGLAGAMTIGGNILKGIGQGGGLTLDSWDSAETTHRGGSFSFDLNEGTVDTGASYTSNQSSDDMKQSSLEDATADAEESGEITNKNAKTEYVFDDFYKAVIVGTPQDKWLRSYDYSLSKVLDTFSHYLSVRDSRLNFDQENLLVEDAQFRFTSDNSLMTSDKNSDQQLEELKDISSYLATIKTDVGKVAEKSSSLSTIAESLAPSSSSTEDTTVTEMSSFDLESLIQRAIAAALTSARTYFGE